MSNAYDYEPPRSGGLFLKMQKGDTVRIRIASDPYIYTQVFDGKESQRVGWIVLHKELVDNKPVVTPKVYTAGMMIYGLVRTLAKDPDWGDPQGYDLKITRTEQQGKYYEVVAVPNGKPITAAEREMIASADINLERACTGGRPQSHEGSDGGYDPFKDE